MYNIGFLGLGKMGSALLEGILKQNLYKKEDIAFYAPSDKTKAKGKGCGIILEQNERSLLLSSSIIVLAIKPQKYDELLSLVKDEDFSNRIIISLAPGKSISYLSSIFNGASIVRAMPNTPATINKATTTLASLKDINKEVLDIFSSVGSYVILKESQIDEAIPLQGSMPAYLLTFAKAFINEGVKHGLSYEEAKSLVLNSIIGSSLLALNSEESLDTLINNVCSKGGSTIEGLNKLIDNNFIEAINECYEACVKRSKELANA